MSTRRSTQVLVSLLAFVAVVGIGLATEADAGPKPMPPDDPSRGLVYKGLSRDATGTCPYLIGTTGRCTSGPDPAPAGVDMKRSQPSVGTSASSSAITVCEGNGTSGYRTQVVYARASDRPSRYSSYLTSFRAWAEGVDETYAGSAGETNGERHVRFVTSSCAISVLNITMSPTADDDFGKTIAALQAKFLTRTDRKYLVFVDAAAYCGIADWVSDDTPGQTNLNNRGPSYSRVDAPCWDVPTAAHEHMHMLGSVQNSAPNSNANGHCLDEFDRMCGDDGSGSQPYDVCLDPDHEYRFDCNHDDYFSTAPAGGSYLATHWNTANSRFLITGHQGATNWSAPGPTTASGQRVDVGRNSDGRLELFYRDGGGVIRHIWQNTAGGTWNSGGELQGVGGGTEIGGDLAVERNASGYLELFFVDGNGVLRHMYQQAGGWTPSSFVIDGSLQASKVAAVTNIDGRLEVFYTAPGDVISHIWQDEPGGAWNAGGALVGAGNAIETGSDLTAEQNLSGKLELLFVDGNGMLRHMYQQVGGWTSSTLLANGTLSGTAVNAARTPDGRLELFYVGGGGTVFHTWQASPGGNWDVGGALNGSPAGIDVAASVTSVGLEVFYPLVGAPNTIWHSWTS